jgi:LCP family protein required for cell wall assembly
MKQAFRKTLLTIVCLLLFGTSSYLSYLWFSKNDVVPKMDEKQFNDAAKIASNSAFDLSPVKVSNNPSYYAVLFIGYGGANHAGGRLADTMIVLAIDPAKKQATLISVPRDLWVNLPGYEGKKEETKLNQAFSLGGGELAKSSVSAVVGLPIQYYIAVDFDSFKTAIDALGKITVDVTVAFDDDWYPIKGLENDSCGKTVEEIEEIKQNYSGFEGEKQFPCRYEQIHFDQGETVMDGETALKFARSRHSSQHGGDFARSQRQMAVLVGVKNKLITIGAFENKKEFFGQLSGIVQTDINERIVEILAEIVGDVKDYSLVQIQLSETNVLKSAVSGDGQFVLVPRDENESWGTVHQFIKDKMSN